MKEIIVLFSVIIIFVVISWLLNIYVQRLKKKWMFMLLFLIYFIFTYCFFALLVYVRETLTLKGIYFEFGHSDIEIIEVFFLCCLLALINFGIAIYRYNKNRHRLESRGK